MIRILLLAAGVCAFATTVDTTPVAAQSRQSTAGSSYQSRSYQENSSANRQSSAASRAFSSGKK
jgi:hypothetical protein